ncbi:MAG TPA: LysR family transcriptional regulator [Bacteriovoracaceae bacterium]|nr:LysR family transcriptional regulator [Bacteriovoracaceae bacterium]
MNFDYLTLHDVEILNDISQAGSIRKIALRRNIAQPALSRKVHTLEACLGAPLFIRNRRGVETTTFGKQCLKLLAEWRSEGLSTSRKIAESIGDQTTIRLGTYDSVAVYFYHRLLKMVHAENLNCQVEIHLDRSREIIREVSEGRYDVGLVVCGGLRPLNLSVTKVAMDEYGFYESVSSRSGHNIITMENSEDDDGNSIMHYLQKFKLQHNRLIQCPSFEVAAALTVAGLGIGILPTRVAGEHIKQKKLRSMEVAGVRTFGRHSLSVIRMLNNKDQMLQKIVKLISAGFEAL